MNLKTLGTALLDLVFAPLCLGCGGIAAGEARLVCGLCRARLQPPPAPVCARCGAPRLETGRQDGAHCFECAAWPGYLRCARSAFLMEEPAKQLIHRLKYEGWTALARPMGDWMAAVRLPDDVSRETRFVVPVPTTASRLRERGYNQAELLAERVAAARGLPLRRVLVRAEGAGTQTTLQPAARRANVARAFGVPAKVRTEIAQAQLLLVDDVLTTGATVLECAGALADAGARAISVITFARAAGKRRLTTY